VHAWVIRHPDGVVLVDTGIGCGYPAIDEWYNPKVTSLADALGAIGLASSDIAAVAVSHLHFDHCGQQAVLAAPVHAQAAEYEAARRPSTQCRTGRLSRRTGCGSSLVTRRSPRGFVCCRHPAIRLAINRL